jgi:hypothetical protein
MKEIVLIGDPRVRAISVKECGEPLVDLQTDFPHLKFDETRNHVQKSSRSISFARKTIGEKLTLAQTLLPSGVQLLIKECYRPMCTFNASPLETQGATYTDAENISELAKMHRRVLSVAMTGAGFVNYPTEWWHWSYGDKYWALLRGESAAIYGSIELEPNLENHEKPQ